MPTTHRLPPTRFDGRPHRALELTHDAPRTSSDGGLLLLRQLDERLGLAGRVAARLPDLRAPERILHARVEQVRQRLFQIALGYEDQNDADALRHDPRLAHVV